MSRKRQQFTPAFFVLCTLALMGPSALVLAVLIAPTLSPADVGERVIELMIEGRKEEAFLELLSQVQPVSG